MGRVKISTQRFLDRKMIEFVPTYGLNSFRAANTQSSADNRLKHHCEIAIHLVVDWRLSSRPNILMRLLSNVFIGLLILPYLQPAKALGDSKPNIASACGGNKVFYESRCRTPTSDAGKKCKSSKECQSVCTVEIQTPDVCFGFVEYEDACTQYLDKSTDRITPGICID